MVITMAKLRMAHASTQAAWANILVGLKEGCILNLVEFGCVGAEIKWDTVCGCGFVVCGLWFA